MPLPLVRLALTALCLVSVLALRAEPVSRTPPALYARQLAPLLTPLDQVLAGRDAFKDSKAHGVILLDETVHFRDEAGIDYLVYHDVYLARTDSAREFMGNRIYSYDREHDSIHLISAATIRPDGERQNLDDRAAFIQTPQREAENGLYTSEQELNLIFPNIVPGAVTETIVLIREDKPVFPGEFATHKLFAAGWPTFRSRLVLDFPDATMARVNIVETSPKVPRAVTETAAGRTRRSWSQELVNEIDWEENAPALRFRAPAVWLSTIDSWDRVSAWFAGLVQGRDELDPALEQELERLTAGLTDRRSIVDKLCAAVANEVRYTGLEFGLAGYQPYPCTQVWANRYGDCKDKANLLRALLARKGIPAHFMLLHTGRLGRIETRSPSWKQFNHVILAVEDGAGGYWYCDPTVRYLPAGRLGLGDSARNVMLVRGDRAEWRQTPDTLDNALHYGAELTLSPTGELAGWFTLQAEGADAAAYADYYNNYKPSDRRRTLQGTIEDFYPGAEVIDVDYVPVTESLTTFKIRAYFLRKAGGAATESIPFGFPASWLPSVDTASERIFPYAATRRVQGFAATLALPPGWNAAQLPPAFQAESAAATLAASWQAEASVLRMQLSWFPTAAELPARDYAVFQRSVRALRTWLEQPAKIAAGTAVAATPAAALENFPMLPTGEGQLRLLGERFPSGERDAERHAALTRVLQWFPEDVTTVFTARIYLSLLEAKDNDGEIARRIGEILTHYGPRVSAESRGWARYLQSRNQWWAAKDPAAVQALREMAADPALSDYRRGWCAHYAALFLAESDPAAALTLLADWDIQPGEARESMLKAEAGYLARLADPAVTAAWAGRILAKQPEDADNLLAITLGEALARKDRLPAAAFEHLHGVLAPLLTDPARFTKTLPLLQDLQALGDAGRQRREFTAALAAWLTRHPQPWLTPERSPRFADLAALEKHLDAMNDAHDAKAVVDAGLQLARFHECDYPTFTKYLYWVAWWLEKQQLNPALLAELARLSHQLPADGTGNLGEIWFKYAEAERKAQRHAAARDEYQTVLTLPAAKPYQRVEASGELALMELGLGRTAAALAAFELTAKEHLTHKKGAEYLTVATLLLLDQGQWDKASALLGALGETKKEYRDETKYAMMLDYLLKGHARPAEQRAYWERREQWRPAWDRLLTKHGVTPAGPHQVPLIPDITGLQGEIAAAATAKDVAAYLRQLDLIVRTAQFIPNYLINACNQTAKAVPLPVEVRRDLMEFGLLLVRDFPAFDSIVHGDARLWEVAFLTDLSRPAEAAQAARTLHFAEGPAPAIRSAALQLWLVNANSPDDIAAAIATATRLLETDPAAVDRADLVANLSDALARQQASAANITLITRELLHPDIIASTEMHKRLEARLNALRQENHAGADFTRELNAWLHDRRLEFLNAMPPASLADPRYTTPGSEGLYDGDSLPFYESIKANLLLARDDHQPMDRRFRAFAKTVSSTCYEAPSADDCAEHFLSAARLKSLPDDIRIQLLSDGIFFLLKNGHAAAAGRLLDGAATPAQRERLQDLFQGGFAVARALADFAPARARTAFQEITAQPLGAFESLMVRALLSRLIYAGEAPLATELVEGATAIKPSPSSGQSPAGMRLDWSRHIKRETAALPFHHRIRDLLVRHCDPKDADAKNYRRLTWPLSIRSLDHQDRAQAVAAAFADNLFTVAGPAEVLGLLATATAFNAHHRELGPDLETAILAAREIDETTRGAWLESTAGLSDLDTPAIVTRLEEAYRAHLNRTDVPANAASRRVVRLRQAFIALRTATADRPEALFGAQPAKDLDDGMLRMLQFAYLSSRARLDDAHELMQQIDADKLASLNLYAYAATLLQPAGNESELALLKTAAIDQFRQQLPAFWMETKPHQILQASLGLELLQSPQLMPAEFFVHALAQQSDDLDRDLVRLAQASLQDDWPAQKNAAIAVLQRIPDYYEALYFRGEALAQLQDAQAARKDLELYLQKSLESGLRPRARQLLDSLPP